MAFADHNERNLRENSFGVLSSIDSAASISQSWQLFLEYDLILTFPDSITIDEKVLWQPSVVHLFVVLETGGEHLLKHFHHLLTALVDSKVRWPLRQIFVTACYHGSYAGSAFRSRRRVSHIYADYHCSVPEDAAVRIILELVIGASEFEIDFLDPTDISILLQHVWRLIAGMMGHHDVAKDEQTLRISSASM